MSENNLGIAGTDPLESTPADPMHEVPQTANSGAADQMALDPLATSQGVMSAGTLETEWHVSKTWTKGNEGKIQRTAHRDNKGITLGYGFNALTNELSPKMAGKITRSCVDHAFRELRNATPEWTGPQTDTDWEWGTALAIAKYGNKRKLDENWKVTDPVLLAGCDFSPGKKPPVDDFIWEEVFEENMVKARGIAKQFVEGTLSKRLKKTQPGKTAGTWGGLHPIQRIVLADMAFANGGPHIAGFVSMQKALVAGDFIGAAREMMLNSSGERPSDWATQDWRRVLKNAHMMATRDMWDKKRAPVAADFPIELQAAAQKVIDADEDKKFGPNAHIRRFQFGSLEVP